MGNIEISWTYLLKWECNGNTYMTKWEKHHSQKWMQSCHLDETGDILG
jgi:hypothetical protein